VHVADDLLAQGQSLVTYNSSLLSRTHPGRLADSTERRPGRGGVRRRCGSTSPAEYGLADLSHRRAAAVAGATLGKSVVCVA